MKVTLWAVVFTGLVFLSIFFALASERVVQRTDSRLVDSMGLISVRGWPLTYESTAPGFRFPQEIGSLNFELDALFYFGLGLGAIGGGYALATRRGRAGINSAGAS